ncbi:type II toxin-antitoxin system RelE/ParE family toxin [Elstera cyanobacteriorum]|uniref:type II toxin-antitoxin system RelE/ParE family toxin n=1 Tax=Elstera cyanobacteriorum TaxID=2022747 RepID=UPI002353D916|nr:type II toxin-antitoxin system RelE/ParE family toxin [Elstera cyanobacteriorum]MCK6443199.1 type II toxin-antitoxin system RelE/ParE family toxin [Elstera cyanobacteriorum]
MAHRLLIRPAAETDLATLGDYLAARYGEAIALAALSRIEHVAALITETPQLGRSLDEILQGIRCFPCGASLIFYQVTDTAVEIVRVLDARRDWIKLLLSAL